MSEVTYFVSSFLTNFVMVYCKSSLLVFCRNLESDLSSETGGNFKYLLVGLARASRDESPNVDLARAQQDAQVCVQV